MPLSICLLCSLYYLSECFIKPNNGCSPPMHLTKQSSLLICELLRLFLNLVSCLFKLFKLLQSRSFLGFVSLVCLDDSGEHLVVD